MPLPRLLWAVPALLVLGSLGYYAIHLRASLDHSLLRVDLDHVCKVQKSYLETRRLINNVNPEELLRERAKHFDGEVHTPLIRQALAEAQGGARFRRKPLDLAAAKAGVPNWKCPELDQL